MNIQSPVRMDKQAFLAWVQTQEERHELDRGRVLMMTGGSRAHWQITFNLAKALFACRRKSMRFCPNSEWTSRLARFDFLPWSLTLLTNTLEI